MTTRNSIRDGPRQARQLKWYMRLVLSEADSLDSLKMMEPFLCSQDNHH